MPRSVAASATAQVRSGRHCNLCGARAGREIFVKNGFSLLECRDCGLVYVGNPPPAEELKRLYSFEAGYHTGCAGDESPDAAWHRRAARKYVKLLSRHRQNGRLLDIGCSTGIFLMIAREHGWKTAGLEMSEDTARLARDRHGLDVRAGTLEGTDFPESSFDVVTLWDVIEHLDDPTRTMSIVHRLLAPGGIVAFLTPNVGGLFPRISFGAAKLIRYWPHPEPPHHLFQFSKATARRLVESAGFAVREVVDARIPLSYSFGGIKSLLKSPKALAYAACFAPFAAIGPLVGAGDSMIVIAQKSRTPGQNAE